MKYFKLEEFACPCCGENEIDPDLVKMADEARDIAGFPFTVTSGYRCHNHNATVGGVAGSSHTKGLAFDFSADTSGRRYRAIEALIQVGFRRIGVGNSFLHADVDIDAPFNVMWTYSN